MGSGLIHVLHYYLSKSDAYLSQAILTNLSVVSFFYFYFYSFLRTLSTKRLLSLNGPPPKGTTARPHKPTLLEELVLGFLAGVASRVVSTPLNIVTLRLQTEREDEESPNADSSQPMSVTEVVKLIYKEQGLAGFWRGTSCLANGDNSR